MLANAAIQSDTLWHHSTRKAVGTICLESIVLPKEKKRKKRGENCAEIYQTVADGNPFDEKISMNLHRAFVVVIATAAAAGAVVVVVAVVVIVVVALLSLVPFPLSFRNTESPSLWKYIRQLQM